jgi:hypothetical protein
MRITAADRNWLLAGGLAALVIIALGWFFVISPQHATTSSLNSQTSDAQGQTVTLEHNLGQLHADSANLPKYQAELAAAQQALPATSGLPDFLRELQAVGSSTDVSVTGVAVSTPVAVGAAAAQSSSASTSTSSAASGVNGPVYSVAITVTATGTPESLDSFLKQLQQVQPRAVLVTTANEGPGTDGALTLTANLQIFIAPATATAATPAK